MKVSRLDRRLAVRRGLAVRPWPGCAGQPEGRAPVVARPALRGLAPSN